MTDKKSKNTTDVARRIWLAGIGAYGKAFEEGRERVRGLSHNLSESTSDAFETLAEKGEKIETAAKVKGAQLAGKASDLGDDLQSTLGLEDRIAAMRNRLSGHGSDDRHDAIEARLTSIEAKLDKLLKAKTPAKAPAKKRATTTRTKKAPVKKAPVKKAPAKKAPAKTTAKKSS
ncbi:MAG: phasin family protein [Litorimonas sp.]